MYKTIPYQVTGRFGAAQGAVETQIPLSQAVLSVPSVSWRASRISVRSLWAANPNIVNATIEGLKSLRTLEEVAEIRGKNPREIL